MNEFCSNPQCANPKDPQDKGFIKDGSWYCRATCYTELLGQTLIEDKRRGFKKKIWKVKLGLLLLKNNLIGKEQLAKALNKKGQSLKRLGEILVESGDITKEELKRALSMQAGIAQVNLDSATQFKLKSVIPWAMIDEFQFVCFEFDKISKVISNAIHEIDQIAYLEEFFGKLYPGYLIRFYKDDREKLNSVIRRNFPGKSPGLNPLTEQKVAEAAGETDPTVFRFMDFLNKMKTNDIKIDSLETSVWIKGHTDKYKFDIYITPK